jgi:hypothetical protein
VYLIGVYLIDVHLIGVHIMGVHVIGVHLMRDASHRVYISYACISQSMRLRNVHPMGVPHSRTFLAGVYLIGVQFHRGVHLIGVHLL